MRFPSYVTEEVWFLSAVYDEIDGNLIAEVDWYCCQVCGGKPDLCNALAGVKARRWRLCSLSHVGRVMCSCVTIPAVTPTFSLTSCPAASPEVPRDTSSSHVPLGLHVIHPRAPSRTIPRDPVSRPRWVRLRESPPSTPDTPDEPESFPDCYDHSSGLSWTIFFSLSNLSTLVLPAYHPVPPSPTSAPRPQWSTFCASIVHLRASFHVHHFIWSTYLMPRFTYYCMYYTALDLVLIRLVVDHPLWTSSVYIRRPLLR